MRVTAASAFRKGASIFRRVARQSNEYFLLARTCIVNTFEYRRGGISSVGTIHMTFSRYRTTSLSIIIMKMKVILSSKRSSKKSSMGECSTRTDQERSLRACDSCAIPRCNTRMGGAIARRMVSQGRNHKTQTKCENNFRNLYDQVTVPAAKTIF